MSTAKHALEKQRKKTNTVIASSSVSIDQYSDAESLISHTSLAARVVEKQIVLRTPILLRQY